MPFVIQFNVRKIMKILTIFEIRRVSIKVLAGCDIAGRISIRIFYAGGIIMTNRIAELVGSGLNYNSTRY